MLENNSQMINYNRKTILRAVFLLSLFLFAFSPFFFLKEKPAPSPFLLSDSQKERVNSFLEARERKVVLPNFPLSENIYLESFSPPTVFFSNVLASFLGDEGNKETAIIDYTVQKGETLYSIAKKYHLKVETIVLANNLSSALIRPGKHLKILPVNGLVYIVKKGDSLEKIAQKYSSNVMVIAKINNLSSPGDIFQNEALVIPTEKLPLLVSKLKLPSKGKSSFLSLSTHNFYGRSHVYPFGQCTWWVAQKRAIPSWGSAKDWLNNAIASGFSVCKGNYCQPRVGAVISLKGSALGHVAYVERVEGGRVIFSEMNYVGWGKMDYRSLPIGDRHILGYIY